MAIRQISVFIENRRGALADVTGVLAAAGIDLRAMSVADTADYGILRLIVNDTDKAAKVLSEHGFLSSLTEVLAAEVPDVPGGLFRILDPLGGQDVNMDYLYAFATGAGRSASVVLRVRDNERTEALLRAAGIRMLTEADLAKD